MPVPPNIFLVGPMGAGKSTVGRQLARALKKRFIDSDKAIEERTGASIALIFDVEGEEGFRKREQAMIDELSALDGIVRAIVRADRARRPTVAEGRPPPLEEVEAPRRRR